MALVQALGADNGGGATTLVAIFPTLTAGSLLSVHIGTSSNSTISGVSDTVNGAWTVSSVGGQKVGNAYFKNSSVSAIPVTVTVTLGGSSEGIIIILEESGIDTTAPLDKIIAQNAQTGVTTASSGATGVLAQSTEVGFSHSYSFNGQSQFSNAGLASGWAAVAGTNITTGLYNALSGASMFIQRKAFAATTSDTSTVTCVIGANPFTSITTYKQAGGGGGGGVGQQNRLLLGVG